MNRAERHQKAIAVAVLLILAVVLSLLDPFASGKPPDTILAAPGHTNPRDDSDLQIYGHVVADMHAGEGYYHASVRELASRGRPVRPFPTIRLPTLVALDALIGSSALLVLHLAVSLAAALTWAWRLRRRNRLVLAGACIVGFWYDFVPAVTMGHEMWAGPLAFIALGLRTDRRWTASLCAALLACAVRETALTLPAVMLVAAVAERRRAEAISWALLITLVGIGYAWHAHLAMAAVAGVPDVGHHMRWFGMDGILFAMGATVFATGLGLERVPVILGMPLILLGLVGWLRSAATDPAARRVSIYVCGWILVLSFLAKIDNFYWAAMYATLVPLGLVMLTPERRGVASDGIAAPENP